MHSMDELERVKKGKRALARQMMEINRILLIVLPQEQRLETQAEKLYKRGTLIVESDPASFAGEVPGATEGDPTSSEVAAASDFDWSALDSAAAS